MLLLRWELAVDQQIGHINEFTLLGKIVDVVSTVAQDPLLSVNIGNLALAAAGVHKTGIIGDTPGFLA